MDEHLFNRPESYIHVMYEGDKFQINVLLFFSRYLLLSRVMRNIRWIMWLTLSCSHSSCRDRKERLISATESSLSSTLSDTEFSDSDWLSPESSTVIQDTLWPIHTRKNTDASLTLTLCYICINVHAFSYQIHIDFQMPKLNHKSTNCTSYCRTVCSSSDNFTHMVVRQTLAVISGLMQTAWHQPVSWRGQRRGCRRCSGCCCPGQSSHWGSTLTPSKIPALRSNTYTTTEC